ncbi:4Fe-4S binding protein [candidate division WOR-3 bacterium]|nr:4Fe-4S binding protein [candidate division WOR-3 bacterium]
MPGRFKVEVNTKWCKGCGICVDVCPKDVFELKNNLVRVKSPEACIGCSICETRCPDFVIEVKKKSVADTNKRKEEKEKVLIG